MALLGTLTLSGTSGGGMVLGGGGSGGPGAGGAFGGNVSLADSPVAHAAATVPLPTRSDALHHYRSVGELVIMARQRLGEWLLRGLGVGAQAAWRKALGHVRWDTCVGSLCTWQASCVVRWVCAVCRPTLGFSARPPSLRRGRGGFSRFIR